MPMIRPRTVNSVRGVALDKGFALTNGSPPDGCCGGR
jgi:hypothetical protein